MERALAHRGPDGGTVQAFGAVGLVHRRLAIIDPEGGRQPLSNEDGRVWITYNGELYNFRELRKELESQGHVFHTHSDTETIVHAYEQWGASCVERFRGMFAFCIADLAKRKLFLARDQFGIKPLYYIAQSGFFAFASEIQALRHIPGVEWQFDPQAIDQYLQLLYVPAPLTVFRQIRKLPPAHSLEVSFDGKVDSPREYWRLHFRPDHRRREQDWVAALDDVLRESVQAHLVADVPFGAFLSGGVDSSTIVAYMAGLMDKPVKTFSIGFAEEDANELPFARQAAEICRTEHHEEIVTPDAVAILPQLVRHYGEPFGDSSAIPTYYVAQMARRHVPMVLSGDGGDEMFAGYHSYRRWMDACTRKTPRNLRQRLRPIAEVIWPRRYAPPARPSLEHWLRHMTYFTVDQRRALWRPEWHASLQSSLPTFEHEFARTQGYSLCHKAQYLDLRTYLPGDILTKVDIASMMHGLEVRTPLVDVRVAEFAATIPETFNIDRQDGQWVGKQLLKSVAARHFPAPFLNRRKMGFSIPLDSWLNSSAGGLRESVQERLLNANAEVSRLFAPAAIRKTIGGKSSNHTWLLLFLEEWLSQNAKGASWHCSV